MRCDQGLSPNEDFAMRNVVSHKIVVDYITKMKKTVKGCVVNDIDFNK